MNFEDIVSRLALEKAGEKFLNALEDEAAETLLEKLLLFMKLKFMFDPSYRRNIENFKGRIKKKLPRYRKCPAILSHPGVVTLSGKKEFILKRGY